MRSAGLEVWFDESELRGGDQWDAKIRKQIDACTLFIPVVSQHTQDRSKGYFRLEWKLAVDQTHLLAEGVPFIAPVVIDDTRESEAVVPPEFMRVQWSRLPGALPTPQFVGQITRLLETPKKAVPHGQKSEDRGLRTEGESRPAGGQGNSQRSWLPIGAAVVVMIGIVVALLVWRKPAQPSATVPPIVADSKPTQPGLNPHRIAVMPLDNFSPDMKDEYLAGGMTEELTSSLSKISGLEVIARTSAERMKKSGKSLSEIGAELRAGTLLEGSVRKAGEQLRISVQLIDVVSQRQLWSQVYDTELKDIFKMQSDVAERVAAALKVALLGSEVQQIKKAPTANLEAFKLYQTGRYWWNKRTKVAIDKATEAFQQALAMDPNYAEAQAGLASCYAVNYAGLPNTIAQPRAQKAAERALELDPTLGEPHAILASAKDFLLDWSGAEREYRLAIQLSPNNATSHQWFGEHLQTRGRLDEGLAELQRAGELDPLSLIIMANIGAVLAWQGHYEQANQLYQKGLELDRDFAVLHARLGDFYQLQHKYPEAIAEYRLLRALDPESATGLGALGRALARSGDQAQARQILIELEGWRKKGLAVLFDIAQVHAGLGDTDQAVEYFNQAFESGDAPTSLNADPLWAELRKDPRIQALLRKMNLVK